MTKGWVYVITNPAIPGLVKIGFSLKDPKLRAKELGNTGVPHPYCVEYEALVVEPFSIEQRAHTTLKAHREGKEWFRCSVDLAVSAVKGSVVGSVLYEHGSTRLLPHQISDPNLAWENYCNLLSHDDPLRMPYLHRAVDLGCFEALQEMPYVCGRDPTLDRGKFQDLAEVERKLIDACIARGEAGDPNFFLEAALLFDEQGEYIPRNEAEFLRLTRLAVDNGSVGAREVLGGWLLDNAKTEAGRKEAFLLLKSAYGAAQRRGWRYLVRCYEYGIGTEKNTRLAWEILSEQVADGAYAYADWAESLRRKLDSEQGLPRV